MGARTGRAEALRLHPPAPPSPRDHGTRPARCVRARTAQGVTSRDGRPRERSRSFRGTALQGGTGEPGLVQPGLLPQGIRAVPHDRARPYGPQCRRDLRGGEPEADLGRHRDHQGGPHRLCLRCRPPGPPDRASRHQPRPAQHRPVAPAPSGGGARITGAAVDVRAVGVGRRGHDRPGHAVGLGSDPAPRLARLRGTFPRGGAGAALHDGLADGQPAPRGPGPLGRGRPAAHPPDGRTDPTPAGRRGAPRPRRPLVPHRHPHRRRTRAARRRVQQHGRGDRGIAPLPRSQGR